MTQQTGSTAVSAKEVAAKKAKPTKAAKQPAAKKAKPKGIEKFRPGTIGRQIAELIVAGKQTNDEILESVKKSHKGCNTTTACVAWYRSNLRKAGIIK